MSIMQPPLNIPYERSLIVSRAQMIDAWEGATYVCPNQSIIFAELARRLNRSDLRMRTNFKRASHGVVIDYQVELDIQELNRLWYMARVKGYRVSITPGARLRKYEQLLDYWKNGWRYRLEPLPYTPAELKAIELKAQWVLDQGYWPAGLLTP